MARDREQERLPLANRETPVVVETMRNAAAPAETPGKAEERIPVIWRIFGGTVLSILALGAVTVYQQITGSLGDLRADVSRLRQEMGKEFARTAEMQGDLVKQDKFSTASKSLWDAIKELRDDRAVLQSIKERQAVMTETVKASDEQQKELAHQVQEMRELKAAEDERRRLQTEVQALRERLAALEGKSAPAATASGKGDVKPVSHQDTGP
jgi:hypothetical protein